MKTIRCGRGLGDSIYLQSVVRYLIAETGEAYKVASDWPDVFAPLGDKVQVIPFTRNRIDIVAHYITRKGVENTTLFRDCCINAGIKNYPELRLDWPEAGGPLIDQIRASGKPVLCVQLPRTPMGRTDGFGAKLLPDCRVIQRLINRLRDKYTIMQVGKGEPLFEFSGIDIDLANRTAVRELLDVCSVADLFLGYPSYILPIAESFRKPAIMVWSRAGLESREMFINTVTPRKLIEHAATRYIIDDCGDYEFEEVLRGLV